MGRRLLRVLGVVAVFASATVGVVVTQGNKGPAPARTWRRAAKKARPLLSILSPPGAGYDSTNVALGTGSGAAVTISRASTQTCEISAGALTSVASNKPCVESGALKVEPSGTNLLLRSEELDNAAWSNILTPIVTANTWDFGTGSATGETVEDDDAGATEGRSQIYTTTTAGAYLYSCYLQSGTTASMRLAVDVTGGTGSVACPFSDLSTATQRKTCAVTAGAGVTDIRLRVYIGPNASGTGSIKVGGCQLETGSVATSYIPTGAATASRAAQTTSLATPAGLPFTSGTIETTVTVQETAAAANNRIIYENRDGTNGWGIYISATSGALGVLKQAGGVTTLSPSGTSLTWTAGTSYRIRIVLGSSSVAIFRDDVAVGTPSWTPPIAVGATSYLGANSVGTASLGGTIRSLMIRR